MEMDTLKLEVLNMICFQYYSFHLYWKWITAICIEKQLEGS